MADSWLAFLREVSLLANKEDGASLPLKGRQSLP